MKSKWITVLIVVSVALNLALAGYLLGSRSPRMAGFDAIQAFPRWARGLPDERRTALRPLVRTHISEVRPLLRSLRTHHRQLGKVITNDPFNPSSLGQVLDEIRTAEQGLAETSHASFIEFVGKLTAEERQQMVQHMQQQKRPPRRPRGPGKDIGPPPSS